ncbi:hypothetical protein DM860_004327 [Cuscuta australis]|uniref:Protein kinase domain-containing protein n=1 Tax=Cuscuta australis TaxID=267555 RepID=A0A328E937_9ASTE|nr:hypothetical protein DM860_004327 [Cuscuta australis]
MGYLSCNSQSAVSISDSKNTQSKKKKKKNKNVSASSSSSRFIQEFSHSDLEAATNGFSDKKLLGKGSHGLVYKGVLPGGRLVAVKKSSRSPRCLASSSSSSSSENPNEIDNEIEILSRLQNPRLVNLVGFTTGECRDRLLVVEFMSNGTLFDALHTDPRPLGWGRRVKMALQTAKAIQALHSLDPPVIHRDIKSANVLIDRNSNARLGDFGLALRCQQDDSRLRSTPPAGTMGYLDPGYVTPDHLSPKTDVFSFGILLLEMISGRKAIDVAYSPPYIVEWAVPLVRRGKLLAMYDPRIQPPKDPRVMKQLAVVATKCVRSCRERRPSMDEVVECLSELSKSVPLHPWANGLTNPCLVVETVGGGRTPGRGDDGNFNAKKVTSNKPLWGSRRIHSDLGSRSNLMDLMAGVDGGSGSRASPDRGA